MTSDMFEDFEEKLTPLIKRQNTYLRESISPAEKFAVTLRHLATSLFYGTSLYQACYIFLCDLFSIM